MFQNFITSQVPNSIFSRCAGQVFFSVMRYNEFKL